MKLYAFGLAARLLIGAGLVSVAYGAHAASFQNGSFELPGGEPIRDPLSSVSVPGWSYNNLGFAIYESTGLDGIPAENGDYYISFGHNSNTGEVLSQTFDTSIGQTLDVSFWVAQQQDDTLDTEQVEVMLTQGANVLYDNSHFINGNAWTKISLPSFVSADTQATLTFTDVASGGNTNWGLDNVSITAVPEPETYIMMLSGLGVLGFKARNRKQKTA